MAWTDLDSAFGYGTKLTSANMQQLRDNIAAAFAKESGSPELATNYVQAAMIAADQITTVKILDLNVTEAKLANALFGTSKLKTSQQAQSYDITMDAKYKFTLTGGEYCFFPTMAAESSEGEADTHYTLTATHAVNVCIQNANPFHDRFGYITHRYVTSSGEIAWLFFLRNKTTKRIIGTSIAPDHPCYGNGGDPIKTAHPFSEFDDTKHEIVVVNPSMEELSEMELETVGEDDLASDRDILKVIEDNYEIDETAKAEWPDIPVTVGLPKFVRKDNKKILADYRFMPAGTEVKPVRKTIPQPSYVKIKKLKKKQLLSRGDL